MVVFEHVKQIVLPKKHWSEILEHCRRKLEGKYDEGESPVRRAYGLVAGSQNRYRLKVERVVPIKKNVRDQEPYKTYMNGVMEQHAVPSKTPISRRGWITDPMELKESYARLDQERMVVFGTYHMHVVPWENDPLRECPTHLDTILGRDSHLFSFIVSMVDIAHPKIRAFFEGAADKETPILIQ